MNCNRCGSRVLLIMGKCFDMKNANDKVCLIDLGRGCRHLAPLSVHRECPDESTGRRRLSDRFRRNAGVSLQIGRLFEDWRPSADERARIAPHQLHPPRLFPGVPLHLLLSHCLHTLSFTMLSAMRFFCSSTLTTQTLITSPTFTTSEGCRIKRSAMREMCTNPS